MAKREYYQVTLTITVTPDQHKAIRRANNRDKENKSVSALVRGWLADYCEARGVEWPPDERGWGGKRKTPKNEVVED